MASHCLLDEGRGSVGAQGMRKASCLSSKPAPPTPAADKHPAVAPPIIVLAEDTSYGSLPVLMTGLPSVRKILFPLHISDLRNAFGKTQEHASASVTAINRHNLPLTDDTDEGDERDVVPAFSKRDAMYDALILNSLLTTLHQERVRYVGIVATDVEDLVFLAHEIRTSSPNTVIFTTNADIRYLHSDVNLDLEGMLVFASYPLSSHHLVANFPTLDSGSPPTPTLPSSVEDATVSRRYDQRPPSEIQFASDGAEGIYNAALVIFGKPGYVLDYGSFSPISNAKAVTVLIQPKSPLRLVYKHPVLHISIVGRNAVCPIGINKQISSDALLDIPLPQLAWTSSSQSLPISLTLSFTILTAICLAFGCLSIRVALHMGASRSPSVSKLASWTRRFAGDAVADDLKHSYSIYSAALVFGLLTAYIIGMAFYFIPLRWPSLPGSSIEFVVLAALSALVLDMLFFAAVWNIVRSSEHERAVSSGDAWGCLAASLLALLLGSYMARRIWDLPFGKSLFEYLRAADVWSGVSPLQPLFYLGIAGICLIACNLWRLNLLSECRVTLPFLGFDANESFIGVGNLERHGVQYLECSARQLPGAVLIIVTLGILTILFVHSFVWPAVGSTGVDIFTWQWSGPIDGVAFEAFFDVATLSIYIMFLLLMLRFIWVWTGLHQILRRLYWHPTRSSYALLRAKGVPDAENLHIQVNEPPPSLTSVESCLESARNLLRFADGAPSTTTLGRRVNGCSARLRQLLDSTERALSDVLGSESDEDINGAMEKRLALQGLMSWLSAAVTFICEPEWRVSKEPVLAASTHDKGDGYILEAGNLFVAARVVDFLRHVFPQLINLVSFAFVGVLAMMLGVSEYPFPGHDTLLLGSWIVLLVFIASAMTVFVQINRERILSMLAGTTPGKLNVDGNFISMVLVFGILPILALLGAQFPHSLGGLFSWIGGIISGNRS